MKPVLKVVTLLLALLLTLSACADGPVDTTQETWVPNTLPTAPLKEETVENDASLQVETLAVVLEAGELYTLDAYPNLKSVNLTGSTCYGAILDFMDSHPNLAVEFTVNVGGVGISVNSTAATLEASQFTGEALVANLQYLPKLTSLSLPGDSLTPEQIAAIREARPDLTMNYTISLLGEAYPSDTTELDLSHMGSDGVDEACAKLGLLPNLTKVTLNNGLSFDDVDRLQTAVPNVVFHYSFSLFGKNISTADEEVLYKGLSLTNDAESDIRNALKILDNCKRFVLDNCGMDSEVLASIRQDFRHGPKLVWRVYFGVDGRYNALTDTDTIRAVYNVTDSTCTPMKYCEDVKYMDIGHNEYLTDLSFVSYMPNIEVLIASGCAVTELVNFGNCKKLTWLELASCGKLTNIDSLAGCSSLRFLNLSFTKVTSYEPLDTLPLERFVCLSPKANKTERQTFENIHPKGQCITVFYGYSNPYGYGWRYDDNGKTFNEYYKNVVREAFNYDYLEQFLPKDDK